MADTSVPASSDVDRDADTLQKQSADDATRPYGIDLDGAAEINQSCASGFVPPPPSLSVAELADITAADAALSATMSAIPAVIADETDGHF